MSDHLLVAIVTGLVSAAGAWGAIRIELKYLRRDVDQHQREIEQLKAARSARAVAME